MKIYFVRHGQTKSNILQVIAGQTVDVEITEEGRKQAEETAKELPEDLAYIYCSSMIRCKQTAEIINRRFGLPITYDGRFVERHMGHWENKPWQEMPQEVQDRHMQDTYDHTETGGESASGVKNRLKEAIENIRKDKKGDKILVVTHGGVIRALHHLLKKEAPEVIHNASVHEFEFEDL